MRNRIREYRKQRGWTIRDLAAQVGTSEATISRLETHQLSISTDWLKRFAAVFDVQPNDLLEHGERQPIQYLGSLTSHGVLDAAHQSYMDLPAPAEDAVAMRLSFDMAPFANGDYLVGRMLPVEDLDVAAGRYCFGKSPDGTITIGRLIRLQLGENGGLELKSALAANYLVPVANAKEPKNLSALDWIAVIQFRINYFDADRRVAPTATTLT